MRKWGDKGFWLARSQGMTGAPAAEMSGVAIPADAFQAGAGSVSLKTLYPMPGDYATLTTGPGDVPDPIPGGRP